MTNYAIIGCEVKRATHMHQVSKQAGVNARPDILNQQGPRGCAVTLPEFVAT